MSISTDIHLEARLLAHVELLAGTIGPRHLGKPSALEATATYIEHQLGEIGDTVQRESYIVHKRSVSNVIVERIGTTHPEKIIVVGAHYDTVDTTPGADDNASAVAMLIEVARLLKSAPTPNTLRFVAFPCEEPPHFYTSTMGSQHYARGCRKRDEKIIGMLALEMVGFYSSAPGSQSVPSGIPLGLEKLVPNRGDFLAAVGNLRSAGLVMKFRRGFRQASNLPLVALPLPERILEIRLSDNSSFWDQGYPALMITDTSFLRNPHYHQPTDTPETLDYPRLAQATLGVAGAVAHLAGLPAGNIGA